MKLRSVELRNVGLTETDNDLPQSSMKLRSVELRNFNPLRVTYTVGGPQ